MLAQSYEKRRNFKLCLHYFVLLQFCFSFFYPQTAWHQDNWALSRQVYTFLLKAHPNPWAEGESHHVAFPDVQADLPLHPGGQRLHRQPDDRRQRPLRRVHERLTVPGHQRVPRRRVCGSRGAPAGLRTVRLGRQTNPLVLLV